MGVEGNGYNTVRGSMGMHCNGETISFKMEGPLVEQQHDLPEEQSLVIGPEGYELKTKIACLCSQDLGHYVLMDDCSVDSSRRNDRWRRFQRVQSFLGIASWNENNVLRLHPQVWRLAF